MSDECVFCKIVKGEIPSDKLYADELVTAFRDINPVAPTHILIIPNKHIPSIKEIISSDEKLVGKLYSVATQLAEQEGIAEEGFRLIINTGPHGGQVVYHLHLHLIGGHMMQHPMG